MKLAFWLTDINKNIDIDKIGLGNPGIGGTSFLILLVAYELNKRQEVDVTLYTSNQITSSLTLRVVNVKNVEDAVTAALNDKQDIFVHTQGQVSESFYKMVSFTELNCITWVHNYLSHDEYKLIVSCPNVKRVIFVGQQLYDHYVDDRILVKSSFIFNCIPDANICKKEEDRSAVVYCGALIPQKGFLVLAKAWKQVYRCCPGTKLYVLGGGLYGEDNTQFKKSYLKHVSEPEGHVLSSVLFEGTINQNKEYYYRQCAVGVANPSGKTETFCLSAVEFEQQGIPVVTYNGFGLLDTVQNGVTGFRIRGHKKLAKKIIRLIEDKALNIQMGNQGQSFTNENFNTQKIIPQWIQACKSVLENQDPEFVFSYKNYWNDLKWLRYCNYQLRKVMPFMPSVNAIEIHAKYFLKKWLKRK